jgi:hypothetical protein
MMPMKKFGFQSGQNKNSFHRFFCNQKRNS